MSDPRERTDKDADFEMLLERYLDGKLSDEDRKTFDEMLQSDEVHQARFVETLVQDQALDESLRELAGVDSGPVADTATTSVEATRPREQAAKKGPLRLTPWVNFAMAAGVLVTVGFVIYGMRQTDRTRDRIPAHLTALTGPPLEVLRGEQTVFLNKGDAIQTGDKMSTRKGQSSVLTCADGTTLTLKEASTLSVSYQNGSKHAYLKSGEMDAQVSKQPEGKPMLVNTPHAQIVVKGTRFTTKVEGESTRVAVTEGSVMMQRPGKPGRELKRNQAASTAGKDELKFEFTRPSDAIVLFDGKDTSAWVRHDGHSLPTQAQVARAATCHFRLVDGALEAAPIRSAHLITRRFFHDAQLHLEFWVPRESGIDSGVWFQFRYGVQIATPDHPYRSPNYYTGGIGVKAPDRQVTEPARTWQAFDIFFRSARFDEKGRKTADARITVFLDGLMVQNNVAFPGIDKTLYQKEGPEPGPIILDNSHGHPVRFRNIWVVPGQAAMQP